MAQLVAHLHGMQGVRGSSPLSSTIKGPAFLKEGRTLLLSPEGSFTNCPRGANCPGGRSKAPPWARVITCRRLTPMPAA